MLDIPESEDRQANDSTFQAQIRKHGMRGSGMVLLFDTTGNYPGAKGEGIWYRAQKSEVASTLARFAIGDTILVRLQSGYVVHVRDTANQVSVGRKRATLVASTASAAVAPTSTRDDAYDDTESLNAEARLRDISRNNALPTYDTAGRRCQGCSRTMRSTRDLIDGKCVVCRQR